MIVYGIFVENNCTKNCMLIHDYEVFEQREDAEKYMNKNFSKHDIKKGYVCIEKIKVR